MNDLVEIGLMIILSGIKYVVAAFLLLAKSSRPWYADMLIVSTGGSLGVYVFTFLGAYISDYFSRFHFFRIKYPKLKKFVKIRNSYGLIGIAILSPVIFSIPIGCIISAAFEHDKWKIIRYQLFSVIFWSVLLFSLKGLFGIDISKTIS